MSLQCTHRRMSKDSAGNQRISDLRCELDDTHEVRDFTEAALIAYIVENGPKSVYVAGTDDVPDAYVGISGSATDRCLATYEDREFNDNLLNLPEFA